MSGDAISQVDIMEIIRLATLAPSGHNTQPWKFELMENTIRIYPDFSRRLPVVDPDDHALYISLGCALENLVIAAEHFGFSSDVECFPANEPEECIVVTLHKFEGGSDDMLFSSISERQSTRSKYDGRPIPADHIVSLESASKQPCVSCRFFMDPRDIEPLIEFVKEGSRDQFRVKAFVDELVSWIRFNGREVEEHRDGLAARSMGLPQIPRWMGNFIMKRMVTPESEAKRVEGLIRSSSGLMMFIAESNDKQCWVNIGRSFERVALTATALGIKHAHINMPCEVVSVRAQMKRHLGLENAEPLLLLRVGYAKSMPGSPRRSVENVMS